MIHPVPGCEGLWRSTAGGQRIWIGFAKNIQKKPFWRVYVSMCATQTTHAQVKHAAVAGMRAVKHDAIRRVVSVQMCATHDEEPKRSWWVGLSREAFVREVAARDRHWRQQKTTFVDYVGERMREGWDQVQHTPREPREPGQ